MTRYLCCLALFGVAAVPDWATAYHPCWVPPPCAPVPAYPPQFYLIPHPVPVYEVPLPPTIHRVPAAATRPPALAAPTPAPAPEPVRPAANTTPPLPLPPMVTPMVTPKAPEPPTPKAPEPKAPASKAPEVKTPPSDVPPLVLPDEPKAAPKEASPLVLPPLPSAVPSPAPAPDADPKRGPEGIPPLVLPPDVPTGNTGVVPPTTARSSPLAALPRVEVFPAAGAAAGALRKVGFFNHSDRDLRLVIEGRPVALPAKSYLHAQLPPAFRWSEAGDPERRETVPADAAGVDVLIRGN